MSFADRTPTLSAHEFRALRGRLASLGVELAGDAQFTYSLTTVGHHAEVPHMAVRLPRVGDMIPDYPIAGFSECIICHHLVYMDSGEARMMATQDVLGFCTQCTPAEVGEESPSGWHGVVISRVGEN